MTRTSKWRGWSFIGAAALASTLALNPLQAQANPIAFGVIAGASVPLGDFGDFAKTGWHAGGLVQWNGPAIPLGIRGEVVYHSFGSETTVGADDVDFSLITATVNGVFMFPMTEPATVRPYIIGGGGWYREDCSDCGASSDAENKGGINVGAGVQIPLSGFTSLIEGRWHMIFDSDDTVTDDSNTTFISLSAGLLFR